MPGGAPDPGPSRDPDRRDPLDDAHSTHDPRRSAQAELERLLNGTALEQELLGLVTAARHGLSASDLGELTGAAPADVEQVLQFATGQVLTYQPSRWDDGRPHGYVVVAELYDAACHRLGRDRLDAYRERLHAWAETYRAPADGEPWPEDTPEYLLTGYPRMLAECGDTTRLMALATDEARHDRMWRLSGGDVDALAEVKLCQELLLRATEPDLYRLALLSRHRCRLESRSAAVPFRLAAVWAGLGRYRRAESLARSLPDPAARARALAAVARAVAGGGDVDHARRLAFDAEQAARSVADWEKQAPALVDVAEAMAAVGESARAEQLSDDAAFVRAQVEAAQEMAQGVTRGVDPDTARLLAADADEVTPDVSGNAWHMPAADVMSRAGPERPALAPLTSASGQRSCSRRSQG